MWMPAKSHEPLNPLDPIDQEFREWMAGFDPNQPCVAEDWERAYRQGLYCCHARLKRVCNACKPLATRPSGGYWPSND